MKQTPRCLHSRYHALHTFLLVLPLCGGAYLHAQSSAVAVDVDATAVIRTIDDRMFGINTAVWDGTFKHDQTLPLMKAIDIRTLRFPGGSTSDTYDWSTNKSYTTGTRTLNSWLWTNSFDEFAQVALALKAQVFITANYGSGTAQQAADWVSYSKGKDYGFKYWEIGNECYGSWEEDIHAAKWDPLTYATEAKEYIRLMKAADPTIKIGVVVQVGEDELDSKSPRHDVTNPRTGVSHHGWTAVVLATLNSLGVTPDYVIYHRYPLAPGSETDAKLLGGTSISNTTWASDAADLRRQVNDYLGAAGAGVELVVTENNDVYSDPGKQSTSLVNGLFYADSFGQLLQTEFKAFVWWALHNGPPKDGTGKLLGNFSSSLYGWRDYGDYGVLSQTNDPHPVYYVMKLLSQFARGGDNVIRATSSNPLLAVYAAKRVDGTLTLLVINKDRTVTTTANFAVHGYAAGSRASVYSYGIPQDEASRTGVGFPDVSLGSLGEVGSTFGATFAPYSATVITLYPASAARSRIVNLSVRAIAGTDSQTLIVGYVIGGQNSNGQLPVLVRALGPTLTGLGVSGALADPQLAMHTRMKQGGVDVDTIVATNDNWGGNPDIASNATRLGALTLNANSLDAALYLNLDARPYTSHVTSATGSGVAIAEVYDGSAGASASTPRLVNISGRAQVSTGDNVLIAGFVVVGEGPKTILIRGLGPSLAALGVGGVLAAPKLELHTRQLGMDRVLAGNLAWGGSAALVNLFGALGVSPTLASTPNSNDTVLLVTLLPGVYTAVISGVNNTTGVALVEVYEVE